VKTYLQFDGLTEATHQALRGRDLRAAKAQALERCAEAGLAVILVAAVEAGVNDHELGAVVRHGIEHPAVRGVVFQPITHAGRHGWFDPCTRLTNADVTRGPRPCPGAGRCATGGLADAPRASPYVASTVAVPSRSSRRWRRAGSGRAPRSTCRRFPSAS
jgi:hypothetical protein